ncbi:DUF58 domain-containing protein [Paenibacillus sp. GSMTC-2017]|uniref:DUF58 domain-containing protein n=1 Tax=Paenibacillus sp. GSMTC-2017 TaxID=2794350 RepID=UPI0018D78CA5|nr:DUF58 domain-containing protein [Paenibacillus sp. GSMTC-2017]MBH5316533.1 DUF58 domain-containing protein [Paenibacillus sp. GSMTC-2017]
MMDDHVVRKESPSSSNAKVDGNDALKLLFPDMSILTAFEPLRIAGGKRVRGTMAGKRRSLSLGGSQEFADYRPYTPGDDVRRIDWNVYGRTGRAYLRQYWDEQELHVHMYVDVSRSMAFLGGANVSKVQYALRLAACIGYAALNGDDRLSIKLFDSNGVKGEQSGLHGRGASLKLFQHLATEYDSRSTNAVDITSHEAPLTVKEILGNEGVQTQDMSLPFRIPGTLPRRSGVTWLFTDAMFEVGIEATLVALMAAGQHIVLVHILSPEEVNPSLSGELKLIDSELGTGKEVAISDHLLQEYRSAVTSYREELKRLCAERGASYLFVETNTSIKDVIKTMMITPSTLVK